MDKLVFNKSSEEVQYLINKDEVLGKLINLIGDISINLDKDYFSTLVKTIIGQMLSAKAAATICRRVEELCGEFTPEKILSFNDGEFRSCGMSQAKVSYIKDLAEKVEHKKIDLNNLQTLNDAEVLKAVTSIKGIGQWTAEMFLIFSLGRLNILSFGDAGLQRSVKWLFGMKDRADYKYLENFKGKWEPYNSLASLYLWEAINKGYVDKYPSFKTMQLVENRQNFEVAYTEGSTEYDGEFYICKKEIGIYCLPSCRNSMSTMEKAIFVSSKEEAEAMGYAPCEECWSEMPAGKCIDYTEYLEIITPEEFSFDQCLIFLNRSEKECTHRVEGQFLYKLFKIDDIKILSRISFEKGKLKVEFLNIVPTKPARMNVVKYIRKWFDLDTDLNEFYEIAKKDKLLAPIVNRYYGLRLIGINDLFEALAWAVIGQQINLNFAYTLKRRMVEAYGEGYSNEDNTYWLFPSAETIAILEVEDLTRMQFTQKKAEYLIGVAKLVSSGVLSEEELRTQNYEDILSKLTAIRGIGRWSADYVIMKCLRIHSAFPVDDVGLKNAVKAALSLNEKPSNEFLRKLGKKWAGYEGYATFYLWQSLSDL